MKFRPNAKHLSNDWIVGIVGGVIAAIVGAYILAVIGVGSKDAPSKLPRQSTAEQITVDVSPSSVRPEDQATVRIRITNALPNSNVAIDGFDPSGSTLFATTLRTDDRGIARTTLSWPPEGWPDPAIGAWKITAYNTESGASGVASLLVLGRR